MVPVTATMCSARLGWPNSFDARNPDSCCSSGSSSGSASFSDHDAYDEHYDEEEGSYDPMADALDALEGSP